MPLTLPVPLTTSVLFPFPALLFPHSTYYLAIHSKYMHAYIHTCVCLLYAMCIVYICRYIYVCVYCMQGNALQGNKGSGETGPTSFLMIEPQISILHM